MPIYSNISLSNLDSSEGWITFFEGLLLFPVGFLVAALILSRNKLKQQKEFIIYFGILLYDSLWGLGFFLTSTRVMSTTSSEECK